MDPRATDGPMRGKRRAVASVSDGQFVLDTTGEPQNDGLYLVLVPELSLDASELVVQARLRIEAFEGTARAGFGLAFSDGATEYNLLFGPDGGRVNSTGAVGGTDFLFDNSIDRTYELRAQAGSGVSDFRIDGVSQGLAPAATNAIGAGWAFGDFVNSVSDARTVVDYIRVTVPEPTPWVLGLSALTIVSILRRKHGRDSPDAMLGPAVRIAAP